MRLRPRARAIGKQRLSGALLPRSECSPGFPMLRIEGDLVLSLEAALTTYEVVEATAEERQILAQWGHPFGGVQ